MLRRSLALTAWLLAHAAVAGCAGDASRDDEAVDTSRDPLARSATGVPDDFGTFENLSTTGAIDLENAFFKSFGTNGRSCGTCHLPENGFTVRVDTARALFEASNGQAPLFRPIDGANKPNADVSTLEARRQAYSLLLSRGTFRIGKGIPAGAEFTLEAIADPYGFATRESLSLYRRPPMTANLRFATAFMWDGRVSNLAAQANAGTMFHAQTSTPLTAAQQRSIVDFETALYTAQTDVSGLGSVVAGGGGPEALSRLSFTPNANAPQAPPASPLSRTAFRMFEAWASDDTPSKQAVVRGRNLFNTRELGPGRTCSGCHSAFDLGSNDHSGSDGAAFQAIGTSGEAPSAPAGAAQFLASDLPVYTLKNRTTGQTVRTNDPGRGLVTGKWADIGRFKTPNLRGLAARAPYFHNGLARTLLEVVDFYDKTRAVPAGVPFSNDEKSDLVAFMSTL